jgi:hypothetical protein
VSGRFSGSHHGRICPAQLSAARACRWIRLDRGWLPASAGPGIIMVPGRRSLTPMTKRISTPFRWGFSVWATLTPVEASPSSLTTHTLEAPREETSLAACSREKQESRVEAGPRSATSASVGPLPHRRDPDEARPRDGKRNRHLTRPCCRHQDRVSVASVAWSSWKLCSSRAVVHCPAPKPSVRLLRVFLPSQPLSWEMSHEDMCRNNETEPV